MTTAGAGPPVPPGLGEVRVADGDPVAPELVGRALTAGRLVFDDGATQVFEDGGGTTYVEHGRSTRGQWYVDGDGRFASFWPPAYRARYDLRWMVEDGVPVGIRFIGSGRGSSFEGRYRADPGAAARPSTRAAIDRGGVRDGDGDVRQGNTDPSRGRQAGRGRAGPVRRGR